MTGWGGGRFEVAGYRYRVEVKSVNHRHLSCRVHAPGELAPFEPEAKTLVKDRLDRGAVDVYVELEASGERPLDVRIDRAGAEQVMMALTDLAHALGSLPPTLDLVLRVGNVVEVHSAPLDPDQVRDAYLAGLGEALDGVVAMRTAEGAALAKDMLGRLDVLDALLEKVEAKAPEVQAAYEVRLRQRLDEAGRKLGMELDPGRLAAELVLFADRSDVTEETVRARAHVASFRRLLGGEGDGAEGKRLDFLAQELGREFNTIGSKCRDAGMAAAVVDGKVELERIREQVQNLA